MNQWETILYWVTWENSIEFLVQNYLPYIYTKLLVYAIVSFTYSKDYALSLRLIYVKYIIVTLFLSRSFYHVSL